MMKNFGWKWRWWRWRRRLQNRANHPNSTRMYSKSFCFSQLHPMIWPPTTRPETTLLRHSSLPMMNMASHYLQAKKQRNFSLKTNLCSNNDHPTSDHHPNGTKARSQDGNQKKTVGSLHLDIQWLPFDLPPQKKETWSLWNGDNILFGCQWLPYPEPKALMMLQAKICYMFPYQSDGFHVKIYQTTRLPWFLRSLEVQMLISGNLFGRCFSELKKSPQIHGVHVSDHGKNPSMSPQNESCRVKIHPKGIENPSYTLNLISSEKQRSTKAFISHNQQVKTTKKINGLVPEMSPGPLPGGFRVLGFLATKRCFF